MGCRGGIDGAGQVWDTDEDVSARGWFGEVGRDTPAGEGLRTWGAGLGGLE